MKEKAPNYLKNLIPICQSIKTRTNRVPTFHCRTDCFKNSFFPSTLSDWFKLDVPIRNSEQVAIFKSRLSFILPVPSNVYNIFYPIGLKFLTRLHLGFSHLNQYRFRHNFQDCMNPWCFCSLEIENALHYLLHCHNFSQNRINQKNSVKSVSENFNSLSDNVKKELLLYGDPRLDENKNKFVLEATLSYLTLQVLKGSLDPYLIKNSLSTNTHP